MYFIFLLINASFLIADDKSEVIDAVIPLDSCIPDKVMQSLAQENNLSETAFFYPTKKNSYKIRWFTLNGEVELCGHATLAAAYVIFNFFEHSSLSIDFESLSGILTVTHEDNMYNLDFPSQNPKECEIPQFLKEGLGEKIDNYYNYGIV